MSLFTRTLITLLLAAMWPCQVHAATPEEKLRSELQAIETLSETSTHQALERLRVLEQSLGTNPPYHLYLDLLRLEVWLSEDAGDLERSYEADRKTLRIAQAHQDQGAIATGRLGAVRQMLDQSRNEQAQAALDEIKKSLPNPVPTLLAVAMASVEGDILNVRGHYDRALASYLLALKLHESTPDAGEVRSATWNRIAQIYINTENPVKALEATAKALKERPLPARAMGRAQFTQGIALVKLNRMNEALASFQRALKTAQEHRLAGLEAATRGNIADYHLRRHDYARAGAEARLALETASKVKDETLVFMAKANLGFALMGQGQFAEGTPYIEGVIAEMEKAGAVGDLIAMLDEKGRMQEQAGMYKDALATVRRQQVAQETEARAARDKAIASLQEGYEANQRTREIELLRRENQLKDADLHNRRLVQMLTTFAAVLTVLAGAVMWILYRRAARSNAQLHLLNNQLEYHSMRDPLTGLHNRRSFTEKMRSRGLRTESERRYDTAGTVDCIALMDIDHFKQINDRWGHGVGDTVLVEVARRLGAAVRDTDMVLRWGGEEFLIFAPGADPAHVHELVKRVLDGIGSTPLDAGTCTVAVTLTAGVISLPFDGPADGADWERGIRLADWALYQGKANGRNQAQVITRLLAPADAVLAACDATPAVPMDSLLEVACVRGPGQDAHA